MKLPRLLFLGALSLASPALAAPENPISTAAPILRPSDSSRWEKEILAFEAQDKKQFTAHGAILFVGSSSIRFWRTLDTDFPGLKTLNRGFGGSHIKDSVAFAPRIVWPYAPSKIVFYAGGNDLQAGKSPQQVLQDWQSFVGSVRQKLPDTEIIFLSIVAAPSRWKNLDKVHQTNALIEDWGRAQKNVRFVDVFTPLLEDGLPRLELFRRDRLHLTPAGYAIWREILAPVLTQTAKPKSPGPN